MSTKISTQQEFESRVNMLVQRLEGRLPNQIDISILKNDPKEKVIGFILHGNQIVFVATVWWSRELERVQWCRGPVDSTFETVIN